MDEDEDIEWYEQSIIEELQNLSKDGITKYCRTTLYRGLGLPEKAVQIYHELLKSGKEFTFTGFTSTSCEKE